MASCEEMNKLFVEEYLNSRIPPRPIKALITMLSCFSVLGLVGNSLVLYVYARKRSKLSSTVFIIALAGIDLVTSAIGMPYTMVVECLNYQISTDFSCKMYYFVITCTVPFSVFIMVAISIDRYICICRPHSHVLDSIRARNAIVGLLGIAIAIGVVTAMFYGVYLDVGTLQKSKLITDPVKMAVRDSMTNITNTSLFFQLSTQKTCANYSTNKAAFSEQLIDVVNNLYKQVCIHQHPFNESYIYTGRCFTNQLLFSDYFRRKYQTIYSSFFLICFSVVFVLYIMIYRSVLARRARRMTAKCTLKMNVAHEVALTENQTIVQDSHDKHIVMANTRDWTRQSGHQSLSFSQQHLNRQKGNLIEHLESQQKSGRLQQGSHRGTSTNNVCVRDKYLLANIRTAIMLFVVTVAFVIAYLPSWLMAFKVIKFNVIVFYVYFSNHIVNPIIYAFMNPAFRRSLKGLLCRKRRE